MNKIAHRQPKLRTCSITRRKDETPVQENLSVSPAQMRQMNEKGIAISTQNLPESYFIDGNGENSFFIPITERRGIDSCTLWEEEQSIKKKMRKARKNDIAKYGQYNPNKTE